MPDRFQSADVSAHSKFERRRKLKDQRGEVSVISTEVEKSLAALGGRLVGQIMSRDSSTALGMTKSEHHRRGDDT